MASLKQAYEEGSFLLFVNSVAPNILSLAECSVSIKFSCDRQVPSLDCMLCICALLCLMQQLVGGSERKSIF